MSHHTPTEKQLHILYKKAEAFDTIAEILFPNGDMENEWRQDNVEDIGDTVRELLDELKDED